MLKRKLKLVEAVFDTQKILNLQIDKEYIKKYYKANKLAYSLFHTYSDKIYMGISRDGIYKDYDLLEAARTVERYIVPNQTTHILELASGRGATSVHLAKKYPNVDFLGIELSQGQLDFAQKKAKNNKNYHPSLGDYHDLSQYDDNSVDIVFVIEALCYSQDKTKVLSEVKRILRPAGVFIILDGYTNKDRAVMTKSELAAVRLTETSMAVTMFEDYPSLISKAKRLGFRVESSEDVSQYILPTLSRFERLAARFFNHPKLAKLVVKIFSKEFAYNAISGLLMPDLVKTGLASYHITVLRK